MRFMFTRLVTKFVAFRRQIADLVGYTGGDSLEQMVLDPTISGLPAHSYSSSTLQGVASFVTGDTKVWETTPQELKKSPARFIQTLPNYRRPSQLKWLEEKGKPYDDPLTSTGRARTGRRVAGASQRIPMPGLPHPSPSARPLTPNGTIRRVFPSGHSCSAAA